MKISKPFASCFSDLTIMGKKRKFSFPRVSNKPTGRTYIFLKGVKRYSPTPGTRRVTTTADPLPR